MLTEGGQSPRDRLIFAFRRATARTPAEAELRVAPRAAWTATAQSFQRRPVPGRRMDPPRRHPDAPSSTPLELAAYTATASVILNLDETITQE